MVTIREIEREQLKQYTTNSIKQKSLKTNNKIRKNVIQQWVLLYLSFTVPLVVVALAISVTPLLESELGIIVLALSIVVFVICGGYITLINYITGGNKQ